MKITQLTRKQKEILLSVLSEWYDSMERERGKYQRYIERYDPVHVCGRMPYLQTCQAFLRDKMKQLHTSLGASNVRTLPGGNNNTRSDQ